MNEFTHIDVRGASRMVDVGEKTPTRRFARASGRVKMSLATWQALCEGTTAKGPVLETARIAGIMAAKKTGDLIPLCHPLSLDSVTLDFDTTEPGVIQVHVAVHTTARTGVEMEALTAVTIAALTIYDMCKALDRSLVVHAIQLEEKAGGQSGHYLRKSPDDSPS